MQEDIREFALNAGANLVGFSKAENFGDAPEGFRPTDIMPGVKSVIAIGKALSAGTVYSDNKAIYTAQGEVVVRELDVIASKVAFFIEEHGGSAVPIPTDAPYFYWDEERQHGMGILSHRHIAEKAGLGVIGKGALLITPEYGSRITLVTVLSNIDVTDDAPKHKVLCPPSCHKCLDACPAQALSGNGSVIQKNCRSHVGTKSSRGHELTNCWNCRLVCPLSQPRRHKV